MDTIAGSVEDRHSYYLKPVRYRTYIIQAHFAYYISFRRKGADINVYKYTRVHIHQYLYVSMYIAQG